MGDRGSPCRVASPRAKLPCCSLTHVGASQRQRIELVEQVVDAKVESHLLPGVAAAQVDQPVTRCLGFVAHVGHVVFRRNRDLAFSAT